MKFIKLTTRTDNVIFVRPEFITSFGPSSSIPPKEPPEHRSWIHIRGDRNEIFVMETCDQISRLLDA